MTDKAKDLIIKTLKEKSCMKQDVYSQTKESFEILKEVLSELAEELKEAVCNVDDRIEIEYKSMALFEAQLKFAGDVLLFHMHTNVFDFEKTHPMWKTSYVKDEKFASFCGMISVYNFLSDSLKYNRPNDSGYLVARIFVNKDGRFFVEGKKQLGFMFNDFVHSKVTKSELRKVVESAIQYSLEFDLQTPPYGLMSEITVHEVDQFTNQMQIKTAKRLGFRFENDENWDYDKKN